MDVVVGSLISVESLQAQAKRMIWWSVSTKSPTGGNAKTQDSCLPKAAPHSRHIYILYTIDIYRYQAVGGDCGFVSTFNSMITISRHLERGTTGSKNPLPLQLTERQWGQSQGSFFRWCDRKAKRASATLKATDLTVTCKGCEEPSHGDQECRLSCYIRLMVHGFCWKLEILWGLQFENTFTVWQKHPNSLHFSSL